jgi:hypothetical protein
MCRLAQLGQGVVRAGGRDLPLFDAGLDAAITEPVTLFDRPSSPSRSGRARSFRLLI